MISKGSCESSEDWSTVMMQKIQFWLQE